MDKNARCLPAPCPEHLPLSHSLQKDLFPKKEKHARSPLHFASSSPSSVEVGRRWAGRHDFLHTKRDMESFCQASVLSLLDAVGSFSPCLPFSKRHGRQGWRRMEEDVSRPGCLLPPPLPLPTKRHNLPQAKTSHPLSQVSLSRSHALMPGMPPPVLGSLGFGLRCHASSPFPEPAMPVSACGLIFSCLCSACSSCLDIPLSGNWGSHPAFCLPALNDRLSPSSFHTIELFQSLFHHLPCVFGELFVGF